jgi:hypothetical protein
VIWILSQPCCSFDGVRTVGRLISMLAICSYLVATFIPCESLPALSLATQPAQSAHGILPEPEPESRSAPMAASHSHSHGASHPSSREPGHESRHESGFEEIREAEMATTAEFKPTCQCGCSDTRSRVGGSAARLGSVVPGRVMARLLEVEVAVPAVRVLPGIFDVHFEIDPIPI